MKATMDEKTLTKILLDCDYPIYLDYGDHIETIKTFDEFIEKKPTHVYWYEKLWNVKNKCLYIIRVS